MKSLPRRQPVARWLPPTVASFIWLLGCFVPPAVRAYVLEGQKWPDGHPIVMDLQLGSPAQTLIDGSTSWNDVAASALAIWNPYLGSGVEFQSIVKTISPGQHDKVNSVFFSDTAYGDSFGDDTLAVTISFYDASTDLKSEADVVFNSTQSFDSYRGPLRRDASGGEVFDLRRVAIHEFGHVLGLGHVRQSAVSIMTPAITDIDTIQADDMDGAEELYGDTPHIPAITSVLAVNAGVGQDIIYRITASESPTSYQATGLPSWLSFDAATGVLEGMTPANGVYEIAISATNAEGNTGRATLILTVSTQPVITSSLNVITEVGKPFSYVITASPQAVSFDANGLPAGLSVNAKSGLIYGTPTAEGSYGTHLDAINAAGTGEAVLNLRVVFDRAAETIHRFSVSDGAGPSGGLLLASDGYLYGTTSGGGANGEGTIFRLANDGTVTTLYSFSGPDGAGPAAGLIQTSDGNFYGVTKYGGASFTSSYHNGYGSIFRCTPDGTVTTLYSFSYDNVVGAYPTSALAQGSDGNLYGSTTLTSDTTSNSGTIFRLTPDGALTVAHSFVGTNLSQASPLILGTDGYLYGTTAYGGNSSAYPLSFAMGTVFRLANDGTFAILHAFDGITAGTPSGGLIQAGDGNFYGVAVNSNLNGPGLIYRITPAGAFAIVHQFGIGTGSSTPLVQGSNGNFYGTTGNYGSSLNGNAYEGTIFEMTPDGTMTTVHYFDLADGLAFSGLVQGTDGEFYGTASTANAKNSGTIFKTALISEPRDISLPVVTLVAPASVVIAGSGEAGEFLLTLPEAQPADMVVNFTIKGSAVSGEDYAPIKNSVTIKAGKLSKSIKIMPLGNLGGASKKVVTLILEPSDGYTVGTTGKVKVKILPPE